jgi:hypothetical protein
MPGGSRRRFLPYNVAAVFQRAGWKLAQAGAFRPWVNHFWFGCVSAFPLATNAEQPDEDEVELPAVVGLFPTDALRAPQAGGLA